jgi:hypothetical protein
VSLSSSICLPFPKGGSAARHPASEFGAQIFTRCDRSYCWAVREALLAKMASSLTEQLTRISTVLGVKQRAPRGKASLLYDRHQAADIDLETIYDIGQSGNDCPKRSSESPGHAHARVLASISQTRKPLAKLVTLLHMRSADFGMLCPPCMLLSASCSPACRFYRAVPSRLSI